MSKFISRLKSKELRFYEIMQVRLFQKMVFTLEHFIHRHDGGYNENYHFVGNGPKASVADEFTKYLFFNGSIHVKNSLFLVICLVTKTYFVRRFDLYTSIMILLLIKDSYCIMLQRYNYLRIRKLKENADRKKERLQKEFTDSLVQKLREIRVHENDQQNINSEVRVFIRRIRKELEENQVIKVTENDLSVLQRIKSLLD